MPDIVIHDRIKIGFANSGSRLVVDEDGNVTLIQDNGKNSEEETFKIVLKGTIII